MAATQAMIDALEEALFSGELSIAYQGKRVEFRSVTEIREALAVARAEKAAASGTLRRRVYMKDPPRSKGWSS